MDDEDGDPPPGRTIDEDRRRSAKTGELEDETTARCIDEQCREENNENMILCNKCKKYIHFTCTRLPPSVLQRFMTKGFKKYECDGCYGPVHEDYINNCFDKVWMSREKELLSQIEELMSSVRQANEENSALRDRLEVSKGDYKYNLERIRSLEQEAEHRESLIKEQDKTLASLRETASTNNQKANEALHFENTFLTAKITEMNAEIEAYSQSIQDYEASEVALKQKIRDSEASLVSQQEKFDQAGNPDFDNLVKLEQHMKKEIVNLGKSIKESLIKEIQENNKLIEEKLSLKQTPLVTGPWHTQSGEPSENEGSSQTTAHPVTPVDFRTIIQEQQKQQIDEVNDQRSRARNVIIHGVKEVTDADKTEAKKGDEDFVKNLLRAMAIEELNVKSVNRIGMKNPEKKRPLLVVMNNEADKDKLLQNLTRLKDQENFKGISVTEDYTVAERKLLTEWREKAKTENSEEEESSKYIWRVRGTPKNGLSLKRFMKQRPSTGQTI